MSRPLRLEFPGGVYYVTARGNAGQALFTGVEDARRFMELLGREVAQQRWLCHGFCLVENHYHLLIETPEPNLARGMARLNMTYSQWFGRRHARRGHLFEGRYHTKILEKEPWLPPVARHLVLNPVRLQAVNRVDQWRWSSYRGLVAENGEWPWLHTGWLLSRFDGDARAGWRRYVDDGTAAPSPWAELRGGHYLGGETFLRGLAALIEGRPLDQVPAAAADPLRPTREQIVRAVASQACIPVEQTLDRTRQPDCFRVAAYLLRRAANMPLRDVAALSGVSPGRISQIQREIEESGGLPGAAPWAAPLADTYLAN